MPQLKDYNAFENNSQESGNGLQYKSYTETFAYLQNYDLKSNNFKLS